MRKSNAHKLHRHRSRKKEIESTLGHLRKLVLEGDAKAKAAVKYLEYLTPQPFHKTADVQLPPAASMHTCNTHVMKRRSSTRNSVQLQCVCGKRFDVSRKTYELVKEKKAATGSVSQRPASLETGPSIRQPSSAS